MQSRISRPPAVGTRVISAIALGTLTGMRSMSGLAIASLAQRRRWAPVAVAAAIAELAADKTPWVGNRIDAAPLLARAALGGIVGGRVTARRRPLGALAGATAAVAATFAAFHVRRNAPGADMAKALVEDVIVAAIGACLLCSHLVDSDRCRSSVVPEPGPGLPRPFETR